MILYTKLVFIPSSIPLKSLSWSRPWMTRSPADVLAMKISGKGKAAPAVGEWLKISPIAPFFRLDLPFCNWP